MPSTLAELAATRRGTKTTHAAVFATIERMCTYAGGVTIAEVAKKMGLSAATVRTYVRDLHEQGYLGTGVAERAVTYFVTQRPVDA